MTTNKTNRATDARPTHVHTCVNGERVEYAAPSTEIGAFLARLAAAAADRTVGEPEMVGLIYGRENPLLDHALLPGRSMVTADVLKDPVYRVQLDHLDRKRVQLGTLDLAAARARHTMTAPDAAARLGVSAVALRKAIATGRLAAWREDGQFWLDPAAVAAFAVDRRGPSPHLHVCFGNKPGTSFKIKHAVGLVDLEHPSANVHAGTLAQWKRVALYTSHAHGDTKTTRFLLLEPGGEQSEYALEGFYVRGRFTIVDRINNAAKAAAAWKAFEPE